MRLKQISKRSLAILLTVLMVLSSLMVGTITTANAVGASGGTISSGDYLYYDVNAVKTGGVNWLKADGNKGLDYTAAGNIPSDGIIKIKLTGSYNFNELKSDHITIFKCEKANKTLYE